LDFDVIVSGLGPAGCTFLRELRRRNPDLKVLALDRAEFPRHKPCAGGLTPKAYRLLKELFPELDTVVERRVNRFKLFFKNREVELPSPDPLVYLTKRKRLDHLLFKLATENTEVKLGETVLGAEKYKNGWKVKTDKRTYTTKLLIGADGVNSRLSRQFKVKREIGFTYEVEVKAELNHITIDFTGFKWGYYWAFPKEGSVTTGAGEFKRGNFKKLRELTALLNRKHGLTGRNLWEGGFPIPAGRPECDVQRGPLLFLGDAAGLVDPLTGEGIYYAARSGQIAAAAVSNFFSKGPKALEEYRVRINREFGGEFRWARVVGWLFFKFPSLNLKVVKNSPQLIKITAELLTGELPYRAAFLKFIKLAPKALLKG